MRFSFMRREPAFLGMLDEMAAQVCKGAGLFLDLIQQFDDLERRGLDLKRQEEVCDDLVAEIIQSLNRTFLSPLDLEDVHTLTTRLDDVMDTIEETGHRFVTFRIDRLTAQTVALARIVNECCAHLEPAVRLCRDRHNAAEVQNHLHEVARLESDADRVYRDADAELFASTAIDPLSLIKWRELYSWLEEAVDSCKKVAQVLTEIVIKQG
jgi:uncharacterized protein